MLKPLSQKSIEKKYAELGLPEEKIKLLHTYFLCFANLYGVIDLRGAWDVFRHYNGNAVKKKDFITFSGIVQREAGHPYSVYEMKEIYTGETTVAPIDRLIVNNELIMSGYNKFIYVYATVEHQLGKSSYLPEEQEFLSFTEDRFYLTDVGKNVKKFVEELVSDGFCKGYVDPKNGGKLLDINGEWIKGKRLADVIFYTPTELFNIDYVKSEAKKEKLREEYKIPASEKILDRIKLYFMTGGVFENYSMSRELEFLLKMLNDDFGVTLTEEQTEQFFTLLMMLNNKSNLWQNFGWTPEKLFIANGAKRPQSISIGPNMKAMFASGELDKDEFEEQLKKLGIAFADD